MLLRNETTKGDVALITRSWTINRLRGRLQKVERAKEEAMHAMIVRDWRMDERSRFDYQDPGQIGSMLDEIAVLQERIAGLEEPARIEPHMPDAAAGEQATPPMTASSETQASTTPPAPVPRQDALDLAFHILRSELNRLQQANPDGRIGVDALHAALSTALCAEIVRDAAFEALRTEMIRLQRTRPPGGIGLDALRQALRVSFGGAAAADPPASPPLPPDPPPDGRWPLPDYPGYPLHAECDGWHWVQAPGKPLIVLSWHADTRTWRHRAGIAPDRIAADAVAYFGPCAPPMAASRPD